MLHGSTIREPLRYSSENEVDLREPLTYTKNVAPRKLPPELREYFAKLGRKGGLKGGNARAKKLTPEQRSESARRAVQARWAKKKAKEADV